MELEGIWIKVGAKFEEFDKALAKLPHDVEKVAGDIDRAFKIVGVRNLEKEFRDAQAAFSVLESSGVASAKQLAAASENVAAKFRSWKTGIAESSQELQKLETIARVQVSQALQSIGSTLSNTLTRPLLEVGTASLKLGSDFQQAQIAFTTMLGSASKANAFLADLKAFAAKTPFEFPGLVDAARRLQAMGFAGEQVIPILRSIGNAAAALGGGAQSIDRITTALGQMQAKGKVSTQEINQLAEAGINAWKILAEKMGKSIPEVMKLAEKGMINAARAVPEILAALDKQYAGMMDEQAKTIEGRWKNLKDKINFIMMDLGKGLEGPAGAAMDALHPLADLVHNLVLQFNELPPAAKYAGLGVAGIAVAAGPTIEGLGDLGFAMVGLKSAASLFGIESLTLAGTLGLLKGAVVLAAGAFAAWKLGEWLYENVRYFKIWGDFLADLIAKIPGVQSLINSFAGLPAANKSLADSVAMLESKLKAKGIVIDRAGLSLEEYSKRLRNAVPLVAQVTEETKKNTDENKKNEIAWLNQKAAIEKAAKAHKEAAEAAAAHAKGVALVGELAKRHAKELADEAANMAKATDAAFKTLDAGMKNIGPTFHELYANLKRIGTEGVGYLESLGLGVQQLDAGITNVGTEGVAYLESLGIGLGKLDPPTKQAVKNTNEMEKAWGAFGQQVSTILTDFGKGIADSIIHAKSFGDAFTKMANALKEAFLRTVVEGAIKEAIKGLDGFTASFSGLMSKMTSGLGSLFGGGGGGAAGAGGGASGGASGGLGGAAGALGGVAGMIGSIGSLISGVIGNFQMSGMNKTLDLIEKEVRYSQIHLQYILEMANTWWPWLDNLAQLQRLESIERVLYEQKAILDAGLRVNSQGLGDAQQTTINWLKHIAEGVWATYQAIAKPGWQTTPGGPVRFTNPSVPTSGGGDPTGSRPPVTIQVNVTGNSSNPYTQGLQVAQGINALLPARI